jgi:hypothetical protein
MTAPSCNHDRVTELEQKVSTLESTIERLDADRKTFVRHAQTTARNVRKLIAENRAFRADVNKALTAAVRDVFRDITKEPRPYLDPRYTPEPMARMVREINDAIADPIAAARRAFK